VGDGRRRYFPVEFGLRAFGPGVEAFAMVVGVVEVAAERALQFEALQERGFQGGLSDRIAPRRAIARFPIGTSSLAFESPTSKRSHEVPQPAN
jgi:hypothetical protein